MVFVPSPGLCAAIRSTDLTEPELEPGNRRFACEWNSHQHRGRKRFAQKCNCSSPDKRSKHNNSERVLLRGTPLSEFFFFLTGTNEKRRSFPGVAHDAPWRPPQLQSLAASRDLTRLRFEEAGGCRLARYRLPGPGLVYSRLCPLLARGRFLAAWQQARSVRPQPTCPTCIMFPIHTYMLIVRAKRQNM